MGVPGAASGEKAIGSNGPGLMPPSTSGGRVAGFQVPGRAPKRKKPVAVVQPGQPSARPAESRPPPP